mmetsp:Transcript_1365/g.1816  ORF Transcript_1365/g.1816 Transcript_1365/m.1816 type:complete len:232 (+) Transcript_1365:187-882(+)|eukprot:CAMPEP_0178920310 /NCGR_PEP_ID=MMETSP0786-20121207/14935_1 /TAXON_ID=186022 /ORGANISM="Thalassionema frauenfeldii, Strain CCMP 1798" /LENGTH=231 /DNA_ID=CAMNT_0020594365 /DNA_START=61 /DNA_END=756 /DNA_ORIENTATION=+
MKQISHEQAIGYDANAKIFPQRLMEMLEEPSNQNAIVWLPNGKAFKIIDGEMFANTILPKYFRKTKYTSFVRKLNRWNFKRVDKGSGTGAFYHNFFQRGKESMCTQMYCNNHRSKFAIASRSANLSNGTYKEAPKTPGNGSILSYPPLARDPFLSTSSKLRPELLLSTKAMLASQRYGYDRLVDNTALLQPQVSIKEKQMLQKLALLKIELKKTVSQLKRHQKHAMGALAA